MYLTYFIISLKQSRPSSCGKKTQPKYDTDVSCKSHVLFFLMLESCRISEWADFVFFTHLHTSSCVPPPLQDVFC